MRLICSIILFVCLLGDDYFNCLYYFEYILIHFMNMLDNSLGKKIVSHLKKIKQTYFRNFG